MFLKELLKNVYESKMGHDLFNEYVFVQNVPYRNILELMKDPYSFWFDNSSTVKRESRDDIIRKSMDDALNNLENIFGKDLTEWQWGRLHKVLFKHSFSGGSKFLDKYIDIGPFEIGGDGTTIFNTEYPFTDGLEKFPRFDHKPFENNLGPVMRYIYDFAKPNQFYLILSTGESGNVMSDHYSDMTPMWLTGKYMLIRTDLNSIENSRNQLLIIKKKD